MSRQQPDSKDTASSDPKPEPSKPFGPPFNTQRFDHLLKHTLQFIKAKKGKIRKLDPDAIQKRLMNNFCKFVKIVMRCLNLRNARKREGNTKFVIFKNYIYSKKHVVLLLNNCKFINFFESNNLKVGGFSLEGEVGDGSEGGDALSDKEEKIRAMLDLTMFKVFRNFFLNSDFFHLYLLDNIQKKSGKDYLQHFLQFIKEMVDGKESR